MKTLASPSSGILAGESWSSFSRDPLVCRPESFFRPLVFVGVLHLASARQRAIKPVLSLSPEPQVDLDNVDDRSADHWKSVHVKFQIQKECSFGDELVLVGDDPMLGLWDPDKGITLTWSDDHVWTAEMDIPIGKTIQYKFILKESTGTILWQPGPDRTFQSWKTINTITVSEEWEDAQNQKLLEDDGFQSPNVEPIVNSVVDEPIVISEMSVLDEPTVNSEMSVVSDDNFFPAGNSPSETPEEHMFTSSIPSQEKPMAIVTDHIGNANKGLVAKEFADNIGNPKKDLVAQEPTNVLGDTRINHAKMETVAIPKKDKVIAKDTVAQNSIVAEVKDTRTDIDKNQTTGEAGLVLVPDLTLAPSKVATEEAVHIQQEESVIADVSDGPDDVKSFKPPELDKKHEPDGNTCLQETTETFSNGLENYANLKQQSLSAKEEHHVEQKQQSLSVKEVELPKDEELHAKLEQQQPLLTKDEEEQVNSEPMEGFIGNDGHWGLRTLQKLLAHIGLA